MMDLTIHLTTGHRFVIPKLNDEDFAMFINGWVDPKKPLIGVPFGERNQRLIAKSQIAFVEVEHVQ